MAVLLIPYPIDETTHDKVTDDSSGMSSQNSAVATLAKRAGMDARATIALRPKFSKPNPFLVCFDLPLNSALLMKNTVNRRHFLQQTGLLSAGGQPSARSAWLRPLKAPTTRFWSGSWEPTDVASPTSMPSWPCPTRKSPTSATWTRAVDKGIAAALKRQQKKPQGVKDFRRILDDPAVHVL